MINDALAADAALRALRQARPLVHCVTNYVAMNVAANVLLASGASPAMIHAAEEAGDFAGVADALTVNIGTLSPPWLDGMKAAVAGARKAGKPWVLDPVAHFATPYRAAAARDLLALGPTIVRGNASEVLALGGGVASGGGADSGDSVAAARPVAEALARETGAVIVVTGAHDIVTDGGETVMISGGSPLMAQVTAIGCSLTALTGAFAAVAAPFQASVAAAALFAEAGARAAADAAGPGSFAWRFLDALATVSPEDLTEPAAGRVRPA